MTLIRSPMLSQVDRVVAARRRELQHRARRARGARPAAAVARGATHGVVLMVELGDLREGILPGDLADVVRDGARACPASRCAGIGTNLACQSGVAPDAAQHGRAVGARRRRSRRTLRRRRSTSCPAATRPTSTGRSAAPTSGGSTTSASASRSCSAASRCTAARSTACTPTPSPSSAEVIESKVKPSRAVGRPSARPRSAPRRRAARPRRSPRRRIVALGTRTSTPPASRRPPGIEILGASSDHLVARRRRRALPVGAEVRFQLDYSALLRAMTSPFVARCT